jgi:translation initiation factor 1
MAPHDRSKPAADANSRPVWSTETGDLRKPGEAPARPHARPPARPSSRPASAPAGGGSGIRLRLDRRASGRVVTVVSGLPGSMAEIDALAKQLKAACGTGGTVKDGALELQGDHRAAVETALAARGLKSKRAGG